MAMKQWMRRMQPLQLYIMLVLTTLYFLTQLVMSHMTHALTLLVDSSHMLCNLIALVGCIVTVKKSRAVLSVTAAAGETGCGGGSAAHAHTEGPDKSDVVAKSLQSLAACPTTPHGGSHAHAHSHSHAHAAEANSSSAGERRLRNTFGWARIDVLVTLVCCVFLASLCFSLCVEALQTLVHIDHSDEMHHPIPVMSVGALGILVNGVCYLLIGGYSFHQGSFLHMTESGVVVLDNSLRDKDSAGQQQQQGRLRSGQSAATLGAREMCRDLIGCVLVIVCSIVVYCTDEGVAKYVDPLLAIVSAVLLLVLSYPYMKQSGLILLQTIPDHISINAIRRQLLKEFPDIVNVHELHVWQLTSSKVFATAHVIFLNTLDYTRITNDITEFFYTQGITQVTIQPEFYKASEDSGSVSALPSADENDCLVPCPGELCHGQHCCSHPDPDDLLASVSVHAHAHAHSHAHSHSHSHAGEPVAL